jgi:hypothetical protein
LRNHLRAEKFGVEVELPWTRDPIWYAQLLGSGLDELINRPFASVEVRAASVAGRIEGIPLLVEQALTQLDPAETMRPHTEVAITQLDGVLELIDKTILERLADAPAVARERIGAAKGPAVAAVEHLQTHLREVVLPVANGKWRLGGDTFARKLALTLQASLAPREYAALAQAEHERVRQAMADLSAELAPTVLSAKTLAQARASGSDALIHAVLGELATYHVAADALRDAIEDNVERLQSFVAAHDIVPQDEREQLEVIWTPPHQRGVYIAGLAAPGPLEHQPEGLPSFYLVQPLPSSWTAEQRESFLREYNNFMLEVLSIHEAIPGHFVQQYYAKREPSIVRRLLQNGSFVEGWAVYSEKVMVEAGYAGAAPNGERPAAISKGVWAVATDPRLRAQAIALHRLKFYLRTVTNSLLDYGIHTQNMSEDEALALMVERSFQQEGEARGKWTRAQVTATQLSTYFVGAQAWFSLRAEAERRAQSAGQSFDQADFHRAALSHGAPPISALPELMGWDRSGGAEPTPPGRSPTEPVDPSSGPRP